MIYDCFSFFNELDLLEIRLNTLDKVVDKFILAESTLTFTGNPKPLFYLENKDRFSKFNDRIIHIVVNDFPSLHNATHREMAWIREYWQRNAIMRGIPNYAKDDDYIIISDIDEIPRPDAIKKATSFDGVSHLFLSMFYYFVNYKNYSEPIWHGGPQVFPLHILHNRRMPTDEELIYPIDRRANNGITPSIIRFLKPKHIIQNAGWHFSYCGGIEAVILKINSISHTENNTEANNSKEHIASLISEGKSFCNNIDRFFAVTIDSSFPEFIIQNQERFSKFIFPVTTAYKVKSIIPRIFVQLRRHAIIFLRPILPRALKDWLFRRFLEHH